MTVLGASVLAGLAVALLIRSPYAFARRSRGIGPPTTRSMPRRPVVVAAALPVVVALVVGFGTRPHLGVILMTGCAIAYSAAALRRRAAARTRRHQRQAESVDICDAFVSELAAGSPPPRMLAQVAADWPFLQPVARAADLGGDVTRGLRLLAATPGRAALGDIAAAWEVSVRSGAGLAGVLDRLAQAMRADDDARQEVLASLAAPRATARVLAALPAFGLALGAGLGGDPVGVLFGTMLGAICLAVGSALAIGGLFWVEHIADAGEVG